MKKLFAKLFLASFPVLAVVAIYLYYDPFKVLYHYDSYFPKNGIQHVILNKDYVSTETFINNYPKYHYDSYIFGNSRSMCYFIAEWQKHINSDKCYHFDASGESLYGIERKFQFLSARHVKIKNALIILDQQSLSVTKNVGETHLYKKHPLLSGQKNLDFQIDCLDAFFDLKFLRSYVTFLITHKVSQKMIDELLLYNTEEHYDVATNEISFPKYEELIAYNKDSFYTPRANMFYKRDSTLQFSPQTIKDEQKMLLNNIKRILVENNTDYRFVISPLYDQRKFDTTDLAVLKEMFGNDKVFDFSGINNLTGSIYNYYESSHYRPFIANQIMDTIYDNKSK